MARARLVHHGDDLRGRHDRAVRRAHHDFRGDDLGENDRALRRERGLVRDTPRSLQLGASVAIGDLAREDRQVRSDRRDEELLAPIEWRRRLLERRVRPRDVATEQRLRRDVLRADRSGEERLPDGEIAVIADLDPARLALLEGAAVAVTEAGGDVPDPRRLDARDAARADELVKEDVGDGTDEREVALALADELVREREWDRRLERAADRDGHAVADVARDGLAQRRALVLRREDP